MWVKCKGRMCDNFNNSLIFSQLFLLVLVGFEGLETSSILLTDCTLLSIDNSVLRREHASSTAAFYSVFQKGPFHGFRQKPATSLVWWLLAPT